MKPKFLEYSLEQLLDEKEFVSWVVKGSNNDEWRSFLKQNPGFGPKAAKARKIILLLRDCSETIDDSSIQKIWENVEEFERLQNGKIRRLIIGKKLISVAAAVILVLVGSTIIFLAQDSRSKYQFERIAARNGKAHVLLSSGQEIPLKKTSSSIALDDKKDQVIINDSIINLSPGHKSDKKEELMNEVVIPYGNKSDLLLADGTQVWLNAGSRLAFPSSFTKEIREVYLEGEACFHVATNESKPFIVRTGNLEIKALGTLFNVSSYASDKTIETVLLEGKVIVANPKALGLVRDEILMKANQKVIFKKADKQITVQEAPDASSHIAWTRGWLEYRQESLASVLLKVERYFNVKINLPANYPADDKITGKLNLEGTLDDVMRLLADASGFHYRINNQSVAIIKNIEKLPARN